MNISKSASALVFSMTAIVSAQAEDISGLGVLIQISYEDCHKVTEIDSYMKQKFNLTAIRNDGIFAKEKAALYANPADDSYAIVVYPDSATLIPIPKYPLACLFGKYKEENYSVFLQSEQYKAIFGPK